MISKLLFILGYFKKSRIHFLILSLIAVSLLEVIGVGVIIPFISILLSEDLFSGLDLFFLSEFFKDKSQNEIIILITAFIILFFLLKNIFILIVFRNIFKYVSKFSSLIRNSLFKGYISQDYKDFSKEDQSRLVSNISNVTYDFSNNFLSSILIFLSEFLVILSIFIFMLFFKFWLSITLILIIIIMSFLYFKIIAPKLKNYGSSRLESEENVIKYCKLGFQNIKELKIFSKELFFFNIFKKNTRNSEDSNFFYNFSAQFPRIGIEIFSVFGICLLIIFMVLYDFKTEKIISLLAFFGVAIFRMIPSINRLMFSYQTIRYNKKTLDVIYEEIYKLKNQNLSFKKFQKKFNFLGKISYKNISFNYANKSSLIENGSFIINKGDLVGITGDSGSGKSTLLDIMIGLLKPVKGEIYLDDKRIDTNSWQNICGYVSQNLFFYNDTVAKNIAFGEPDENINNEQINNCIKICQLENFLKENKEGIKTYVGENGNRLSGGQRQRLAIARALYRNPEILFLDEATNALDAGLETKIIHSIQNFNSSMTIVLVSHNKKLITMCNNVIEVKNKVLTQSLK